ncbi:MAG: methyltransferase domain-containing protein [Chloroflexota bacterium]
MAQNLNSEDPHQLAQMEKLLLEYTQSYSRYYSRSKSKLMQRCREQLFQEREMGALVDRLERLYGRLEGCRVLEVGSGSGSRSVAVALRGAEVTGIEPSEAGVAASRLRAQRYPHLKVRFDVGIGEELPFPDGSFDLVFSTEVLQHVQNMERVIAETSRVLRPGGHCYHEAPNNLYPWEFHYRMLWFPGMPKPLGKLYARLRGKDPRHLDDISFIYPRPLSNMMRRHGFTEIRDLYEVEFWQKTTETERIHSSSKRKAFELLRRLGLSRPIVRAISFLGIYPQVKVHAVKTV